MAIRALLDCVQISVRGQAQGQAIVNVLHYRPNTLNPNFGSTITQALTSFRSAWRAAVLPALVDDYQVSEYHGVLITGTEPDPLNPNKRRLRLADTATLVGAGAPDTGGSAADPLPTYTAFTVRKLTGKAGRSNHGSARIGPLPETFTLNTNGNQLTIAALTAAQACADMIKTVLGGMVAGDSLEPVVFSRTNMLRAPVALGDALAGMVTITDAAVNVFVGSQVSRKQRATIGA